MGGRTIAISTVALVATLAGLAACDTDDGREMDPPTSIQRWQLASTTPSTTSTLAPLTPLTPVTELAPTTVAVASSGAESSASGAPEESSPATPAAPAGSVDDAGFALGAPWADGGAIDVVYTCDGENRAPLITWTAPPAGAAELALAVTDDDAGGFVHWAVIGLPPTAGSVGGDEAVTVGTEAANDSGSTGWTGPCPPPGAPHTYRATVYVLAAPLTVATDAPPADLVGAMSSAATDWAELTGTYQRAEDTTVTALD